MRVKERDAAKWLWIAILERDGVRRKCDLMREIESVLKPVQDQLVINATSNGLMIDRIGSIAQFYGYDCGNGRNWVDRQTGGVNGMLSFNDGCVEQAKVEADFDLGLLFFDDIGYEYKTDQIAEMVTEQDVNDLSFDEFMEQSKGRVNQLLAELERIVAKYAK